MSYEEEDTCHMRRRMPGLLLIVRQRTRARTHLLRNRQRNWQLLIPPARRAHGQSRI
jgi:hypothetical protein